MICISRLDALIKPELHEKKDELKGGMIENEAQRPQSVKTKLLRSFIIFHKNNSLTVRTAEPDSVFCVNQTHIIEKQQIADFPMIYHSNVQISLFRDLIFQQKLGGTWGL